MLGATAPRLGTSTMSVVPSPPDVTPPGDVVTTVSKGNKTTPVTPGGGVGNVGVLMFAPVSRLRIETAKLVRTSPGPNAPTAEVLKVPVVTRISTTSPARMDSSGLAGAAPK